MTKTNINTIVEYVGDTTFLTFLYRLESEEGVANLKPCDQKKTRKEIWLHDNVRQCMFDMTVGDVTLPVKIHSNTRSSKDKPLILDIFTSAEDFVNLKEYNVALTGKLMRALGSTFEMTIEFNGISNKQINL